MAGNAPIPYLHIPSATPTVESIGAQPLSSDLTAIDALATTAYGRSFLALANAAAGQALLALGAAALLATDTDTTLAANSDIRLATQKAVKAYVDAAVTGLFDFKGSTDASGNPNYPAASKGDAYVVTVAGKVGGGSGTAVDIGDVYVASADNAGGTQAAVGTSWFLLEHNLAGALLAANNLSDLANATTALTNLGGTAPTGTGALVRATSPSLTTPALGTPASGVATNLTGTALGLTAGIGLVPPHGNSFPSSPASGDWYHRDDRAILYRYDGTRWLSVTRYTDTVVTIAESYTASTNPVSRTPVAFPGLYDLWIESVDFLFIIVAGTALDGSNSWQFNFLRGTAGTSIASVTINSGTLNNSRMSNVVAGVLLGTTNFIYNMTITKVGTPGTLYCSARVNYRLVG